MPNTLSSLCLNSDDLKTDVLAHVVKPGRYLGLEYGAFRKNPDTVKVTTAMIFPDLYEIGVSNYGHKLLYSLINNDERFLCDRAYAPAKDMMAKLKEAQTPLYGLESLLPLKHFDILAFTLQYELNYTSILGVLDAAQIPFRTKDRGDEMPLLIAGGPGSANPMPLMPFFDAFILGDGEEVMIEILELLEHAKNQGWSNQQKREGLAKLDGVYVSGLSTKAQKRIVDITQQNIEIAPLIPHIQGVHDRVVIEARRGCDRMCRFCQPCFINLPVREQTVQRITEDALKEIDKTGYEECSLLSLSIADYSQLKPLITDVVSALKEKKASISLPSQRADRFDLEVAEAVQTVRKSTLTFAPEAGTERLRAVINKNLTETEIMKAVTDSFRAGWNKVKLYFMIGLPTETDQDLLGIVALVKKMKAACDLVQRDASLSKRKHLEVNVTLSNFVPKPHTPFQWWPQDSMKTMHNKIRFLKDAFAGVKGLKLNFTDPELSKLECLLSKGDERLADVIELAYEKGGYLDAWEEHMTFPQWFEASEAFGIDADEFTAKCYVDLNETLPWDGFDVGVDKPWLQEEYRKSVQAEQSDPCFVGCNTCGVCTTLNTLPVFMPQSALATYNIGTLDETKAQLKERLFPEPIQKVRLVIQKQGNLQYISHLDWLRLLHRAVQRSGLPIAHTQGFNPTPKISFGPPLPIYVEGQREYIDLELISHRNAQEVMDKLNEQLPDNGKILEAQTVVLYSPSIDKLVNGFTYIARWTCKPQDSSYTLYEKTQHFNDRLQQQPEVTVEVQKKGRTTSFNLKPFVQQINALSESEVFIKVLGNQQSGYVKAQWILNEIDPDAIWHITRLSVDLAPTPAARQVVAV